MRFHIILLTVAISLGMITGCKKADTSSSDNVVTCQYPADPPSLHAFRGQMSAAGGGILTYVTETLTGYDPETAKQSGRVSYLPEANDDFTQFTYTIKEQAAWPDGSPIMGEDVLFSLKYAVCPSSSVPGYIQVFSSQVEDLKVSEEDPRKVTLYMRDASIQNPYFMNDVTLLDKRFFDPEGILEQYPVKQMLDQDDAVLASDSALIAWGEKVSGGDYNVKPEFLKGSSGPYQIVEWEQRNYIKLSKRPGYWGKNEKGGFYAQKPDQIVFRIINDPAAIELQLKQGAIDAVFSMKGVTWDKLSKEGNVINDIDLLAGPKHPRCF